MSTSWSIRNGQKKNGFGKADFPPERSRYAVQHVLHYPTVPMKVKETRSVSMNIFRKKYFLFKSFVKIELSYSYIFTINMVSTAENCKEK